ncbi:MAG: hypothetical protein ACI92E_002004 [Oceanicoccus sp.]|jgi:hypothetical protein
MQLLKSGDLSAIYVPSEEDEAIRGTSWAREAAMSDLTEARYRLKALLLRNNIQYKGTANWSLKHLPWLNEIVLPHAARHFVQTLRLHEYAGKKLQLDHGGDCPRDDCIYPVNITRGGIASYQREKLTLSSV